MTFRQYRRSEGGFDAAVEEVKYRVITGVASIVGVLVKFAIVFGIVFAIVFGVVTCEDAHDPLRNMPSKAVKGKR